MSPYNDKSPLIADFKTYESTKYFVIFLVFIYCLVMGLEKTCYNEVRW